MHNTYWDYSGYGVSSHNSQTRFCFFLNYDFDPLISEYPGTLLDSRSLSSKNSCSFKQNYAKNFFDEDNVPHTCNYSKKYPLILLCYL